MPRGEQAGAAAPDVDFVARAEGLSDLIRDHADTAEAQRHLPTPVADAMSDAGLYRVAASVEQLGGGADPVTQIKVIEAVSRADGSTGWNLMIGIESYSLMVDSLMKCAREIIEDPRAIVAGSTAAVGTARREGDGYRVSGHWKFVSGCHNARLFNGLVDVLEDGDVPVEGQLPSMVVLPAEEIEILDTWHVSGIRGSGSHDVVVNDGWAPAERIVPGLIGNTPSSDRLPRNSRLAYNKVGVALGIARAAIDGFMDLASNKVPRFSVRKLQERAFAQRAVAEAEVRIRSARALVFELIMPMWDKAQAGEPIHREEVALFQIACSDAVRGCIEAVDKLAAAAGTTANMVGSPLERPIRDVRVVGQHITVAPHHIEDGGRVLLGLPAQEMMLGALN